MARLKKMRSRGLERLELRRQFFHIFFGIALVLLVYFNVLDKLGLLVVLVAGFLLSLICRKYDLKGIEWFLEKFERKDNIMKFPGKGPIFFVLGSLLALSLFEKNVALAGIMVLTFGDSLSHVYGKTIGKYHLSNQKAIEGIGLGMLASFLGAMIFVRPLPAFLGSIVAMGLEAYELKVKDLGVDDNLFIPVMASGIMYIVMLAM